MPAPAFCPILPAQGEITEPRIHERRIFMEGPQ